MKTSSKPFRNLALLALAATLAACGRDDAKPSSQAAVRVNDQEITVHQLNTAMAQVRNLDQSQARQMSEQVLDKLVEQELLVQKALEQKLDRDPRVMQAIEASKRQLLSQAYLEKLTAQAGNPGADEMRKFYVAHPELFAERRIYRLQELAVPARDGLTREVLDGQIAKAKTLDDVEAWLKSRNTPFNANSSVKAAETLPMEVVPKLVKMKDGEMTVVNMPQGFVVLQVMASDRQPMDEKQAAPFIEQYLQNQRKIEIARSEVDTLRAAAKVEYVGQFARNDAGSPTPAPTSVSQRSEADTVKRGLSGLK